MRKEANIEEIVLGDILTPQEHMWKGSTPAFAPTTEAEWYIPDGVLGDKITLQQAIGKRKEMGFAGIGFMASHIGIFDENVVMGLEEIDKVTGQTINDPKILGIWDRERNEVVPAIDENTGRIRDLTQELMNKFREKGLEGELHLRGQSTTEGQNLAFNEGDAGYRK